MRQDIVIVSGLPRSGTSLMMQMLQRGGLEAVTDGVRTPDIDNPHGYFELEVAKKIKTDSAWLSDARGKVVKMISQLLYDLPATESYRIVLMQRDLEEVLISQEKMLVRLGKQVAPRPKMKEMLKLHLARLDDWLGKQANMSVLKVNYTDLLAAAEQQATAINQFLEQQLDVHAMMEAVDVSLYRNRGQ